LCRYSVENYPENYWQRQGQRGEDLGKDALGILTALRRKVSALFGGAKEASAVRVAVQVD
jgi:hypothetical protein